MAVTGVVLIGFVVGHLVGNLQVYENPDRINGYAHFLQSLGPVLWAVGRSSSPASRSTSGLPRSSRSRAGAPGATSPTR